VGGFLGEGLEEYLERGGGGGFEKGIIGRV